MSTLQTSYKIVSLSNLRNKHMRTEEEISTPPPDRWGCESFLLDCSYRILSVGRC